MSDDELDALVATLGETDWGPNVTDTMTRWDQARRKSAAAITTLRARIAELEVEVEVANDPSPYCPICGSCGEDGCCSAQRCLYSDDKLMARIAELEADRAEWVEVERLRMGKTTPPTPPA